ncbi:sodium- and chloride-dependent glycine transporter 1-like [Condylostylus longicornis]|uniref:sodium- and chloride-dependent glycine transporter 1-like n=1 Tax=Condylostylus longicornis TaxID=2530218 RepID=UPI00244D9BB3|nr:sodium- and chloride-dependent glycine transporter 1-like [Condylostylus longicornis]
MEISTFKTRTSSNTLNNKRIDSIAKFRSTDTFIHDGNRGQWANKTEFILSCISYAIGLGNIWRFPYLCYASGGGAFLIPYLIMLFVCGLPLFYMEIIIGQFSSTGVLGMFRLCPIFKGAGYAIIVVNLYIICYFSVIISYPVLYMTKILNPIIPWNDCSNDWNTKNCLSLTNHFQNASDVNNLVNSFKTPSDEFFHIQILQASNGIDDIGGIVWPLFFSLLFVWILTYICISCSVKSIGKVVYFTALFPYVILTILLIRGVTLPGAWKGIKFYIEPDWNKLLDLKVWADAALQIFYSLGPGWGGIVNTASYNKFRNNAQIDGIIIPIINSSTSIFAGFVVFSVLGFLSDKTGIPVEKVATSGAGLAFITYPQAVSMLPLPHLWAALFFLMIFLIGIGSQLLQLEAVIATLIDEIHFLRDHKKKVTLISCIVFFLLSLLMITNGGIFILQLIDWYSASISVILICIIEVIMVSYFYGIEKFANDISFMLHKYPSKIWLCSWKYTTPLLLIFLLGTTIIFNRNVSYNNIPYPEWAIIIGWCTFASSVICIPIYIIYLLWSEDGSFKDKLYRNLKPFDWTPAKDEMKFSYQQFCAGKYSNSVL